MKKNIFLLSLIFLSLINGNVFSQNVRIKGKIQNSGSESLVRLITFDDMLTCEQKTICETKSDTKGNFTIEANIDGINLAQIAVDLERVDILLKPDSSYDIEIFIPEQSNQISYFEREKPTLKMNEVNDNDIYYQYHMSNIIIDDFLLKNFNKLYRGRKISLLDSLDVEIRNEIGELNIDFIKDNIRYRKAAIQMVVNNDNAKKVINQHFNKQDILYHQAAYMDLFQEIFTNYLSSSQFAPSDINKLLYTDYDSFLKYIKEKDVFLAENPDLAEIILAWNLKRMYYERPNDKRQILGYINQIRQKTNNQKNKKLIDNIIKQINHLSFNSDIPQFSLKDNKGNIFKLSDYKDDMLLVQFVNQISPMTDHQFETLKDFSKQWQDSIKIVTIATRECFKDFVQLFDNKGYNWTLLDLGDDILLLEEYQVKTFPDYVIIGKNNKVGMAPAPSPEQYLDFHVRRIYDYYYKK